jgi:beta-glucosidase
MVVPIIEGIQKNVMAIAKHYINNNQETHRSGVNEVVDEVTRMELYGPPFSAAVQKAAGVMCSYNRINGDWACENEETLKTMLKGYYNFSGFVVSDWGATVHDDFTTKDAVQHGLDIEMPRPVRFSETNLQNGINAQNFTMDQIDDRCIRILSSYFMVPEDKRLPCNGGICIDANVSTAENKMLARKLSAMSTVLLKNSGNILPLNLKRKLNILFIGPDATSGCYTHGSGSGSVVTNDVVCPLQAFTNFFGEEYAKEYFTYIDGKSIDDAINAAKKADLVFIFGSAPTGEGKDRVNLNLGGNIDDVIPAVAGVQKSTIVVLTTGGSILTPWRNNVPVILTNFFPGEQVGPALFDIVFGNIIPQAKLPLTFPNIENEQKMSVEQYPGVQTKKFVLQANYTEGQIVGYRWYDKHKIIPAFEFGFGLSYGSCDYSNLQIHGRKISFSIVCDKNEMKNNAAAIACDTPQIYFGYPNAKLNSKIPMKVLRYFEKVCNKETAVIEYEFSDMDVSNWGVDTKEWKVTSGKYDVYVGRSSKDILLTGVFKV